MRIFVCRVPAARRFRAPGYKPCGSLAQTSTMAQPRRRPCGFKVRRLLALRDDDVGRQRSQAPQIGIYRVLVCGDGQAVHHEIVLVAHILLRDPSRARRSRRTGGLGAATMFALDGGRAMALAVPPRASVSSAGQLARTVLSSFVT
jgi:hypothetical protein